MCCINTTLKNGAGLTPLQVFDTVRADWVEEDDKIRCECRELFLLLLAGIDAKSLTEHNCTAKSSVSYTLPLPEKSRIQPLDDDFESDPTDDIEDVIWYDARDI